MIIAKLSDILGRKTLLLVCLIFFLVFSVACGLARSLDELYIKLRAGGKYCSHKPGSFSELFKASEAVGSIQWSL